MKFHQKLKVWKYSMDPEIVQQLNEQFREMSDILSQQNATMAAMLKAQQDQVNASKQSAAANKQNAASATNQGNQTDELTKKQQAYAQAEKERVDKSTKTINNFNAAIDGTINVLGKFGAAIMDTTQNVTKYNGILNSAGNAAMDLGRKFGIVGSVLGTVVKASTALMEYQLKQKQAALEFSDQVTKLGAVNQFSTDQIQKMGDQIGLTVETMDQFMRPMQKMGTSLTAMGSGIGDSVTKFKELNVVSEETRNLFRRMGYNDEQRIEAFGNFIDTMALAGISVRNMSKDSDGLRKSTQEYVKNLNVLSEITGQSVEEQQKAQQIATATAEFQIYANKKEEEASQLEREGKGAEAKAIREELAQAVNAVELARRLEGEAGAAAMAQQLTLGFTTISEVISGRALKGTDQIMNNVADQVKARQFSNQAYEDALYQGAAKTRKTLADMAAPATISEDFRRTLGLNDPKLINALGQLRDKEQVAAIAQGRQKELEEGKGPVGSDENQKLRDTMVETERSIRKAFSSFAWGIGIAVPALTALAGAAGIAALGIASRGALGGAAGLGGGAAGAAEAAGGAAAAGSAAKWGGRLAKGAKGGLAGLAGGLVLDYGAEKATEAGYTKTGAGLDVASSAATWAGTGAMLGSVIPGLGTLAGGIIGGIGGTAYGLYNNWGKLTGSDGQATPAQAQAQAAGKAQPAPMENMFAESVAGFGSMVASFGKIVGSFADLIGLFATSIKTLNTTLGSNVSSTDRRRQTALDTLVSRTMVGTDNNLSPLESFQISIEDLTTQIDLLREAEVRRNTFNEISMKEFRKGLDDAAEKLKTIAGTGGDTNTPSPGSPTMYGGDMDRILGTIRAKESGGGNPAGDYTAKNPNSSASGAYQFIDSTWQSLTKKYGIGQEYKSARDAPAHIQDEIAKRHVEEILKQSGGDVSKVPTAWHTGNIQGKSNAVSASEVAAYDRDWMNKYNSLEANPASLKSLVGEALALGGGVTGNMRNLENIDPRLESAAARAFKEYYQKTGKKITLTSGYRYPGDQERIDSGSNPKAAPGMSRHERGLALDINSADVSALNQLGLLDKYGLIGGTASSRKGGRISDPPHIELKAAKGGIFKGPKSGYPVELHGGEMVAPLGADSILMKLAKTPAQADEMKPAIKPPGMTEKETIEKLIGVNSEMMESMIDRLSQMVDALNEGNDTRHKILKNSQV